MSSVLIIEDDPNILETLSVFFGRDGFEVATATTAEEFTSQLEAALATDGPALVEAVVPPLL